MNPNTAYKESDCLVTINKYASMTDYVCDSIV